MPRRLCTLLLALLVGALGACQTTGGSADPGPEPRLQKILQNRVLRVGLSGSQPPLNMRNAAGEIIGLEVDLIDALASSMGLETQLVTMPFAALLPALESGTVDLVISGMTITPERNARVAFAGPYFISGKSVLAKAGTLAGAESPEVLDDANRTYATLAGSTSERFVKNWLPRSGLVTTPDYDSAIELVMQGKVDAMVADYPICALTVLRYPEAGLTTFTTPFTVEPLGIALPAGDPLFVNLVQNYLRTLEDTGVLTRFKAKWFSHGDWVNELP